MKVLHGFTGSVATTLIGKFDDIYIQKNLNIKTIFTQSSKHFTGNKLILNDRIKRQSDIPEYLRFGWFDDNHEWDIFKKDQKVLHIELMKWADVFVIAPLSANTLAKIANGLCDNLLTCVARAWDFNKPFIVAPAMNVNMWTHPITKEHLDKIKSWGIKIVEPVEKTLYCGDTGIGAMADISTILEEIKKYEQ